MQEENIKTGAILSPFDERDYIYENLGLATTPFDWGVGYDVEKVAGILKTKDQGNAGSCGGQAWSYYMACLDNDTKEKSAKFIYSQTFVLPAGSAGRTNSLLCKNKGVSDEELCSSYDNGNPPTEEFMQRKSDITPQAYDNALKDKAYSFAQITNLSWDNLAQAIRDNKGIVLGVYGKNNGTWVSKFPTPPDTNSGAWAHWLYAGKALIINGKKYIGVKNSWGDSVGDNGWQYIGEEYIPHLFEVWSMVYNYPVKYTFSKVMRLGSTGYEVKQLQRVLGIGMDGIFGLRTLAEVKKFQKEKGLVADGIVGIKTILKLNNITYSKNY